MKAGILTLYYENRNPGGQLQARALVQAIENVPGWSAEQLPFAYSGSWMKKSFPERVLKNIAYLGAEKLRGGPAPAFPEIPEDLKKELAVRQQDYDNFALETPHNSSLFTPETIRDALSQYDCFVCGGDQIWNEFGTGYYYCALDAMSLGFVPETVQKFSYAPSMPSRNLNPKFLKKLGKNAARLDGLSLREKSSVEDLRRVSGREAAVVADPVLLLTQEQWDREMRAPKEGPYGAAIGDAAASGGFPAGGSFLWRRANALRRSCRVRWPDSQCLHGDYGFLPCCGIQPDLPPPLRGAPQVCNGWQHDHGQPLDGFSDGICTAGAALYNRSPEPAARLPGDRLHPGRRDLEPPQSGVSGVFDRKPSKEMRNAF